MAFDPHQFWSPDSSENPPLTDDMLKVAEASLGVRLPAEYISLLRIQNGGYTHGFGFPMSRPTKWADDHVPLDDLAGIVIDPSHSTSFNLLETAYLVEEWGLPERQVLITGEGHWWITLDYRKGKIPSVTWLNVECDEDIPVAPTFADFLNGLRPSSSFE